MHDSDNDGELNSRDGELSRRIAETLERSAAELDAPTRARLAALRHQAQSRRRPLLAGVALAAGVAAIAVMPWLMQRPPQQLAADSDDTAYLSVDPQMLADMDMLLAIGESQ